ncbi:hypothetical protein FGB62_382g03 [Gracilaria domingensis]|nr:hypothetical protein FGB62_382g03 [Gracilaria domingensis]
MAEEENVVEGALAVESADAGVSAALRSQASGIEALSVGVGGGAQNSATTLRRSARNLLVQAATAAADDGDDDDDVIMLGSGAKVGASDSEESLAIDSERNLGKAAIVKSFKTMDDNLREDLMDTLEDIQYSVDVLDDTADEQGGSRRKTRKHGIQRKGPQADAADRFESAGERKFDDEVPEKLPIGVTEEDSSHVGKRFPPWTKFVTKVPSSKGWQISQGNDQKKNPIEHKEPWLRALFIPPKHRASCVGLVTLDDLRATHHAVYWHAAYEYYRENGIEDVDLLPEEMNNTTVDKQLWISAVAEDDVGNSYFARQRTNLSQRGYCIMEGQLLFGVEMEMVKSYPGEEALRNPDDWLEWMRIINEGTDKDTTLGTLEGIGRYIKTLFGMTTALEQDKNRVWTVRERALVDCRLGQVMACLGVGNNRKAGAEEERMALLEEQQRSETNEEEGQGQATQQQHSTQNIDAVLSLAMGNRTKSMYMPKTGGRWLYTSKGCGRQVLHTDFGPLGREETMNGIGNPGYFVICTGENGAGLWVCDGSHRLIAITDPRKLRALSRVTKVGLVEIPPKSIFVGRGDVFHAGSGSEDFPISGGCIRYHTYFIPEGYSLPDAVHLNHRFQPKIYRKNINLETESELGEEVVQGEAYELDDDMELDETVAVEQQQQQQQQVDDRLNAGEDGADTAGQQNVGSNGRRKCCRKR